MKSRRTYILIDLENIQPTDFAALSGIADLKLTVFVGAGQKTMPADFVIALGGSGHEVGYIRIPEPGKSARDFHITFHIGKLFNDDSEAIFRIISKDRGFDPLIRHMNELGARVSRSKQFAREKPVAIPCLRPETDAREEIEFVLETLQLRKIVSIGDRRVTRAARNR